jgi:hypothetical protein
MMGGRLSSVPDQELLQDLLCRDAILTTIQLSLDVQQRFTVEPPHRSILRLRLVRDRILPVDSVDLRAP